MAKKYMPRITKQINNLSRAINKIDPSLKNSIRSVEFSIKTPHMGINDISYIKDGVEKKVRYDQITLLSRDEQASLLNRLSEDRYALRQKRALEQFQAKGKVSKQFKRSIGERYVDEAGKIKYRGQNAKLLENIEELEFMISENDPDAITEEFEDLKIAVGDDFMGEADSFFQTDDKQTPVLFDFYRPGEAGGFSEMNAFTWNAYQVLKGI